MGKIATRSQESSNDASSIKCSLRPSPAWMTLPAFIALGFAGTWTWKSKENLYYLLQVNWPWEETQAVPNLRVLYSFLHKAKVRYCYMSEENNSLSLEENIDKIRIEISF